MGERFHTQRTENIKSILEKQKEANPKLLKL